MRDFLYDTWDILTSKDFWVMCLMVLILSACLQKLWQNPIIVRVECPHHVIHLGEVPPIPEVE